MTKQEVITNANQRTGNLLNPGVDKDALYLCALQRLLQEQRWWFRKKYGIFASIIGTATYDLTTSSPDFEEMKKLFRVDSSTSTAEVNFSDDDQTYVAAVQDTTTGDPGIYFFEPGTTATVRLSAIPNAVKTYAYTYFAIPVDGSLATIPYLPTRWHWVLQKALEMDIYEAAPGEGIESPNFAKAAAMYQKGVALMNVKNDFSTTKHRIFGVISDAVQST